MSEPPADMSAIRALMVTLAPNLFEETAKLKSGEVYLVHYTSAENAINILKSDELWLRNVKCMNDYSEVQHGINLLLRAFHEDGSRRRNRLIEIFDRHWPGAAKTAIENFDAWLSELPDSTYIACLSQMEPEDDTGRLSMWRAYGSTSAGVALVLNTDPFMAETDLLKAYSFPVAYVTDADFCDGFDRCLEVLDSTIQNFSDTSEAAVTATLFWWFLALSLSLKHPAFFEEREWRIVYIPSMEKSPIIVPSVETIGGIPQVVQKIPLCDAPESGLIRANIPNLLLKLIIGPTNFPIILYDAFVALLAEKGVELPHEKVMISHIPLR